MKHSVSFYVRSVASSFISAGAAIIAQKVVSEVTDNDIASLSAYCGVSIGSAVALNALNEKREFQVLAKEAEEIATQHMLDWVGGTPAAEDCAEAAIAEVTKKHHITIDKMDHGVYVRLVDVVKLGATGRWANARGWMHDMGISDEETEEVEATETTGEAVEQPA